MANRQSRQSLDALTGLRFVLALWVVLVHLAVLSPWFASVEHKGPAYFVSLISAGGAAVGIFFLLSGFVLAYSYSLATPWNGSQRREFFLARFARIYPTYLFGLLLGTAVLLLPFAKGTARFRDVHTGLVARLAAEVLLLIQSWIPQDSNSWNAPSWSLSAEAFFYASFPFLGLWVWRIKKRAHILASLALLWAIMCGIPFLFQGLTAPGAPHAYWWLEFIKFEPLVRLPDFIAGILLCRLFLSLRAHPEGALRSGRGGWLATAGAIVGLSLVALYPHSVPEVVFNNGLLLPASCALLLGLALSGPGLPRALSTRPLRFLGEASFALYLIHEPTWIILASLTRSVERALHTSVPPGIFTALYLVVALSLASLVHVYLERRMRKLILRRFGSAGAREQVPALADPM